MDFLPRQITNFGPTGRIKNRYLKSCICSVFHPFSSKFRPFPTISVEISTSNASEISAEVELDERKSHLSNAHRFRSKTPFWSILRDFFEKNQYRENPLFQKKASQYWPFDIGKFELYQKSGDGEAFQMDFFPRQITNFEPMGRNKNRY